MSQSQLKDLGIGRGVINNRLRTAKWQRVRPGVYRVAGAPATWEQEVVSAVLWAGAGAVASGRAAAALQGFESFERGGAIEVSTTKSPKAPDASIVVHRVERFGTADVSIVNCIPLASPARTIVDLAADCDEQELERALDSALRQRLVTLTRMRWQLQQAGRKRGIRLLARMVAQRQKFGVPQSELERDFLRLVKFSRLEMPFSQYPIAGVGKVDFAYPNERLAIETDGYEWHFDRGTFQDDRARDQEAQRLGWVVLRFTKDHIRERPDYLINLIASLKAERRRHDES
jgi:very-short-patch-repair endonuclease